MYARRKSSSSFCRLVSIHSPSSGRHPKRRRGEKQAFRFQALRRPDAGGRTALTFLARRSSHADGRDRSRVGARQRAGRRAGGGSGWGRAARHALLPRARAAGRSAGAPLHAGARAARPASPARVSAARRATHRAGRLQPRGLPGAARVSALAAATRGAGWPPRARLRVRDAVDKLARMRLTPARRLALALLAAVLAASAGRSDEGAPERVIRYERDLLTVRLTSVPVTDVLDELGRQAGAQIRGQVRDLRAVSVEFEAVPLADALHRLRAGVVAQLNALNDVTLGALFRNLAGDHAQEVAMQVLSTARTGELRSKASVVLQQLRAGG